MVFSAVRSDAYPARDFVTSGGLISYAAESSTSTDARHPTSIVFSGVRSLLTCQCRRRSVSTDRQLLTLIAS